MSFRLSVLLLLAFGLAGCQAGYYAHLARGHYEVLSARRPIAELIEGEATDPALKSRLRGVLTARAFAVSDLALPDNGSYTDYADLERPYVLWNLFATPEFSLKPQEWCHLLVGCLAYRGYYDETRARAEAARLREQGLDVEVAPVQAYSTLGWFDDPVLNTMLSGSDEGLAGTIFHELAHQKLFVSGDTAFNESFASFVEEQGLRQYLRGAPDRADHVLRKSGRHDQFVALVLETRARLEALYALGLPEPEMRTRKQAEFTRLRVDYEKLKQSAWGGDGRYDSWIAGELNNARLLPFGIYHQWVPAFGALFRDSGENWPAFYRAAKALADQPGDARLAALESLAAR